MVEKEKKSSLKNTIFSLSIFGSFFLSFIFFRFKITGDLMLNNTVKSSNVFGALFFIIGIGLAFIYAREK